MNGQPITPYVFQDDLVRVHQDDNDDPWFVAKDVCRVLAISDHHQAIEKLDEDERGRCIIPTPSGDQEMKTVSESGLYALIFRSRKPEAKAFRKWVTSEVLPAIRKTGRFEADAFDPIANDARLEAIKEKAGRVPMRTTQRVAMLNIALQICKAEGRADERTVLARYVSMCDVVVGKQAEEAKETGDIAMVEQFLAECCEWVDGEKVNATVLYRFFRDWCLGRGIKHPPSMAWFGRRAGQLLRKSRAGTVSYCDTRILN